MGASVSTASFKTGRARGHHRFGDPPSRGTRLGIELTDAAIQVLRLVLAALLACSLGAGESFAFQARGPRSSTRAGEKKPAAPTKGTRGAGPPAEAQPGETEEAEERRKMSELREAEQLPRLSELEVPTVELLHKRPVDWLVLRGPQMDNERVIVVRQVFPRPDTLKKMEAALEELRRQPRPTTEEEREKLAAQRHDLQNLVVMLPDDPEGELYEIPTRSIERIIYHEDLIIRRAGLMIDEKRFRDAFELLFSLERQAPDWKGLQDQIRHLLFLEAQAAAAANDPENALTLLEELRSRDRTYPELQERLGQTVDMLIERSRKAHDDRQARHFLRRLSSVEPKHEIAVKWTTALAAEARDALEQASRAARAGRHAEAFAAVDRAAHVWPTTPGLAAEHRRYAARYQRLDVGVLDLPGATPGLPFETLADRRERYLLQSQLFEISRIDDVTHDQSRIFEQWEPTELGRSAVFTLRSARARWESRPQLTAATIVSCIKSRIDPESPDYDERLASLVDSIVVLSPYQFELGFAHAPPRIEPLFRFPVTAPAGPGASAGGAAAALADSSAPPSRVLSRRFEKTPGNDAGAGYRRAFPQPDGLDQYQLAEVAEHKYPSPDRAIQGLLRGDVSMLADLPTWAVNALREDPRFFVLDYALPTTHVIQINPRSKALASRELRLALAYSIDVNRTLENAVLRQRGSTAGRLATAPFATTSYAYNTLVDRRPYSLSMAASLVAAASKRLKDVPTLRMGCAPGVAARAAAADIVAQWKRIGIRVELATGEGAPAGAAPPEWDLAYRTLRMAEPYTELWPFLTAGPGARLDDLRHLPDWLRLELLDLDRTPDWKSAVSRLQELHAHLFQEAAYIPLWEVDDAVVLRKNVRDFPSSKFVETYQDIERWVVNSWYPDETP
jgi:ABC-type transport system substrate-binding protein